MFSKPWSTALIAIGAVVVAPAIAAPIVYFGENLTPAATVTGAPVTARNAFLSGLAGVSTEEFTSFTAGTTAPLNLVFTGSAGNLNATLSGEGQILGAPSAGRFDTTPPTDPDRYWVVSGSFQIDFAQPIAAFGFYGTDIGDFNGRVTVALLDTANNTTNLVINNTLNGPNGSLLFWGFIDPTVEYTRITFGNTNAGTDFFGFDSMTIGDRQQIAVPEPGSLALLGLALAGLAAIRRRRS